MIIDNKYELGEIVYLKTDVDQVPRIVTAVVACPDDSILYELACGTTCSKHYDFEITYEKLVNV